MFEFAPDSLDYVQDNLGAFPNLDKTKVDDAKYVEQWLKTVEIGKGPEKVEAKDWLVMLTGYTPKDNVAVHGLEQRYMSVLKN